MRYPESEADDKTQERACPSAPHYRISAKRKSDNKSLALDIILILAFLSFLFIILEKLNIITF